MTNPLRRSQTTMEIAIRKVASHGLPPEDDDLRVAFIWDGNVISGWPDEDDVARYRRESMDPDNEHPMSADEIGWWGSDDVMGGPCTGVTHYILFPVALHGLESATGRHLLDHPGRKP